MRYRLTLVLLALAAGLGAFYYLVVLPHAQQQVLIEEISKKYFRGDISALEFIRIRNGNGAFDIAKRGEGWAVTAPRSLDADAKAVEAILSSIRAGKILKILSTDTARLGEFGLDRPAVILSLGFSGKIDEIAFGNRNPAQSGVYAYARGVQAIFLVDPEILKNLTPGLSGIRDKTVFQFDPNDVVSVKILTPRDVIDMRKEGADWRMARPLPEKANAAAISAFLAGLSASRAEEVYDHPPEGKFAKTVQIALATNEGRQHRLRVNYWGTGAGEGVLAYEVGKHHYVRLRREFWDFVNRNASSFLSTKLLVVDHEQIGSIEVTRGASHYRIERKRTGWYIGEQRALETKITPFIWFLKDWSAVQIAQPEHSQEQKQPEIIITLQDRNGNRTGRAAVYGKVGAAAGYLGKEQVDNLYAVSEAIRGACLVSSIDLKKIPSKEELLK